MAEKELDKGVEEIFSSKEVRVGDKKFTVRKISFYNTIMLSKKIGDVVAKALGNSLAFSTALSKIMFQSEDGDIDLSVRLAGVAEMISLVGEDAIYIIEDIVEQTTGLTHDEAKELEPEEGIEILFAAYEVNKGFFTRCMNKLSEKVQTAGQKEKRSRKKKTE